MTRRRVEPEPITEVRVYEKGIPEHGDAMEHVARAFGFNSAKHMARVLNGDAPSAFDEAHRRESGQQWKLEDKAWAARQAVPRISDRNQPGKVRRSRRKAQQARRARERAARLAS